MIMTVEVCEMMMKEFEENKRQVDKLQAKNKEIAAYLMSAATFKAGSKTGYAHGAALKAKVVVRENVSWDQGKLELARVAIGNDKFFAAFKPEFKPRSKADLDVALADESARPAIIAAMTTKPGTPGVEILRVADERGE